MLIKSVSRRVNTNCFTFINRKVLSICLSLLLSNSFSLVLPSTVLAEVTNKEKKEDFRKREKQALTLFKNKKRSEIISLLSKNLTTLSFKELVILAEAYKWGENNIKRIQVLEYAKNLFPNKVSVQLELAKTYLSEALSYAQTDNFKNVRSINIEKSRDLFIDAVKEYPSISTFKAYIKFLESTPNSPDEIIATIKEGRDKIGASPFFISKLCHWHAEAGYIEFGLKSCKKAVEIRPKDSESHLKLAQLLADSGQKKIARDTLIQTANRFPASSNAQYFAAEILYDEGKILDALKHLDKAIENTPPDEALVLRAKLLFNLNRVDDSLKAYELACQSHKEPRKPLIKSLKRSFHDIDEKNPLKKQFESALYKCKYVNRPKRKKPKGFISSKRES